MKKVSVLLWIALVAIVCITGIATSEEAIKDIQVYAEYYAKYSMNNQDGLDDCLNISFLLKDEGKNVAADGNYIIMATTDRGSVFGKKEGSLKSSDFIKNVFRWPTDQEITTTTIKSPEMKINGSEFIHININETTGEYENLGHKPPYGQGSISVLYIAEDGTRFVGEARIQFRGPKY